MSRCLARYGLAIKREEHRSIKCVNKRCKFTLGHKVLTNRSGIRQAHKTQRKGAAGIQVDGIERRHSGLRAKELADILASRLYLLTSPFGGKLHW